MTDIRDLKDELDILQCYTCKRVKTPKGWMNQFVPEREKKDVTFDYCPMCDDAQSKLMEAYNRRPKSKIIGMATIAI
jgi:NMD protein affecting ribosome stability and mRNA decay